MQTPVRKTNGDCPLNVAARWNKNIEVTAALLKAGADPNARDERGYTPLCYAAQEQEPRRLRRP